MDETPTQIPDFNEPQNEVTVWGVEDAAQNRRDNISMWSWNNYFTPINTPELIMAALGLLDATATQAAKDQMTAIRTHEVAMLAAIQAIVDSTDSDEDKIAALGLIVKPF